MFLEHQINILVLLLNILESRYYYRYTIKYIFSIFLFTIFIYKVLVILKRFSYIVFINNYDLLMLF